MTILCDVDGVVCDLLPAWVSVYNDVHDAAIRAEDVVDWGFAAQGADAGAAFRALLRADTAYAIYRLARPVDGALEGVEALRYLGHEVVFMSSCLSPESAAAKMEWLREHGFVQQAYLGDWRSVVLAQDKSLIHGHVMIDDFAENLRRFRNEAGLRLLYHARYNRDESEGFDYRVRSWDEVVGEVATFWEPGENAVATYSTGHHHLGKPLRIVEAHGRRRGF